MAKSKVTNKEKGASIKEKFEKAFSILEKKRRQLKSLLPQKKFKNKKPTALAEARGMINQTDARIAYAKRKAEETQATHDSEISGQTLGTEAKLRSENAELRAKLDSLEKTVNELKSSQRQTSLMGRIQLERFDTSTEGKSMSKEEAIRKWQRWSKCLDTIRKDTIAPGFKHQHLLGTGGQFIRDVDAMVGFLPDVITGDPFEDLVSKIDKYLAKDTAMLVHAKTALLRTIQNQNETIDNYLHRLQIATTTCDFDSETASTKIRDQLIAHCRHRKLMLRLATENKSLEDMANQIRLEEAGEKEEAVLAQGTGTFKPPTSVLTVESKGGDQNYRARSFGYGSNHNSGSFRSNRDSSFSQ